MDRVFECVHCGQVVQGWHLADNHRCGDHPHEMREILEEDDEDK